MFAGIGGICTSFILAGAEIVWANEADRHACETYKHNFGSNYLCEGDIRFIDHSGIPSIDILTAGFPCQPFSLMGKLKGFADPRGTLFFEILKVIDSKRPPIILLENVANLKNHDNGKTFLTICHTLEERGYSIQHQILGAHTHGNIPQLRDRIFIIAFLDPQLNKQFAFPKEISLKNPIGKLINRDTEAASSFYYEESHKYYELLHNRITDNNAIYRIDDSGIAMRAWKICPTLKANMGTYRDRVPIIRDHFGIRKLTPIDCLALQGFPNSYTFPQIPIEQIYKQLGNTVCVPVVERIAHAILSL